MGRNQDSFYAIRNTQYATLCPQRPLITKHSGDENRLQQVLHNLVGNAIKFTSEGQVTVSALEQDDMITVAVADKFDDIFKSFEQGLDHYHQREFLAAIGYFRQVLALDPNDKAAQIHLQQAKYYHEHGVPAGWEGVSALTQK